MGREGLKKELKKEDSQKNSKVKDTDWKKFIIQKLSLVLSTSNTKTNSIESSLFPEANHTTLLAVAASEPAPI